MVKRGPPDKIAQVLQNISNVKGRVNVSQLAREAGVSRETLRDAWHRLRKCEESSNQENNEFESNIAHRLIDGRGRHSNRALTDAEERAVVSDLKEFYPQGFNDQDIRHLCHMRQRALRSKSLPLDQHFITRFKDRHSITRSRFIGRTRKKSDPLLHFEEDVEQACIYIDEFTRLSSIIDPSLIINVDETPAYVKNTPATANHFAGSAQPWQWIRASDRLKITVLAACSADGKMLKSTIVAKGITSLCEKSFAKLSAGTTFLQHTKSGLTTSESFIEWIDNVLIPHTLDRASVLIVDQYPAHLADGVRQHLANHNITILEVPARGTALLQPLDVGVFGVAKKKTNANYKEDMFLKDWTEPDRWESTTECVRALGRVDQLSIMRGWQLAFPNYIFELKK